jgi:hypothetical protein
MYDFNKDWMVTNFGEQSGIFELWHSRLHELHECFSLYLPIVQGSAV